MFAFNYYLCALLFCLWCQTIESCHVGVRSPLEVVLTTEPARQPPVDVTILPAEHRSGQGSQGPAGMGPDYVTTDQC